MALNAYPVIEPDAARGVGGIETRAWMFARGLVRHAGADVQFAVRHSRRLRRDFVENVRIVPLIDRLYPWREAVRMCVDRRPGFPWVRVHRWRAGLLWQLPVVAAERALKGGAADPWIPDPRLSGLATDVLCTFGVQSHSATVVASARAAGRPAVLILGSDGDLDPNYGPQSSFMSPYGDRGDLCWRILQEADAIIAQTPEQQSMLRERFGRESVVIANPIDVEEWDAGMLREPLPEETANLSRYALWIGRADAVHKRPQLCVELARLCPEVTFLLIMNPRDVELEASLLRNSPSNVRFVRSAPFSRMPSVFSRAAVLVNTSLLEGFANTLLQAALSRVPVASLQVGPAFIEQAGAGMCAAGDLPRLAHAVRDYWKNPRPAATAERCRQFVVREHALARKSEELSEFLASVLSETGRRSSTSPATS